jgi:ribosomal protein L37E
MTDKTATHGFCRKCNEVQPLDWAHFKQVRPLVSQRGIGAKCFEGMEAKCAVCGFDVCQVGRVYTTGAEMLTP